MRGLNKDVGRVLALASVLAAVVATAAGGAAGHVARGARVATTTLLTRGYDGAPANGASSNAVISDDKRYARVIAFQSDASNIVPGDRDGVTDVFAIKRAGPVGNTGAPWKAGRTLLVSRTYNGKPANGPSTAPAVDGAFHSAPSCVAFLSAASNLVRGDTNGKVDAFVSRGPGRKPTRVSLPGGHQARADTTQVAVSGDCTRVAFVTGGRLYVRIGKRTRALKARGTERDPSFSHGLRNDLVFSARRGVYLSRGGTGRPRLVAKGGRQPAYNDIKRQVVAYEKRRGGYSQIFFRDLGKHERLASAFHGHAGNGDSTNPVVGNSGYFIGFDTAASNLSTNFGNPSTDYNGKPDAYIYSGVLRQTLAASVAQFGTPLAGGGQDQDMSWYGNYVVFDSPAPTGSTDGAHQIYMRYLGGL